MDFKKLAPISLISMMVVVGCSFQKNPNKAAPEPVKVGMTKHELEDEILKNTATTFPDRLAYLIKNDNQSLALKLISEVSKDKVNEYNIAGETAIEITVRADLDDLTLQLLRKGASPYLPRRGTTYAPIDYLNERADSKKDILDMIAIADREFQKEGNNQLIYGPEGILSFLVRVRQPFYKKVDGKVRLIDIVFDSPFDLAHGLSVFPRCQPDIEEMLGLIEKMEGPITGVSGFKLARFGAALNSEWIFKRGLDLQKNFSLEERTEIIEASEFSASIKWISSVTSSLKTDGISQEEIQTILINSLKRMSKNTARREIDEEGVQNFLKSYPDAYAALYAKAEIAKEIEERKKEEERGEVTNSDLPGGKEVRPSPLEQRVNDLHKQLIDLKEEYESCIDKK